MKYVLYAEIFYIIIRNLAELMVFEIVFVNAACFISMSCVLHLCYVLLVLHI